MDNTSFIELTNKIVSYEAKGIQVKKYEMIRWKHILYSLFEKACSENGYSKIYDNLQGINNLLIENNVLLQSVYKFELKKYGHDNDLLIMPNLYALIDKLGIFKGVTNKVSQVRSRINNSLLETYFKSNDKNVKSRATNRILCSINGSKIYYGIIDIEEILSDSEKYLPAKEIEYFKQRIKEINPDLK